MRGSSFLWLTVFTLWMKTYIAYKTSFNIDIDSMIEEFILLINPLSFLLIAAGVSFFIKDKRKNMYLLLMNVAVTGILLANIIFYRFFNDFLTLPVLFQTSNMSDLGGSVTELAEPWDLLYFLDIILFAVMKKYKISAVLKFPGVTGKSYLVFALSISALNLILAETERPQLLSRTFDRKILVKNIGTYNYHLYDVYLQSKSSAQRALADGSELAEVKNYLDANRKKSSQDFFGIAKGKNVICVSMESLQSFVINEKANGEEITPFLNQFIKESYYFNNFYHQTGQGKTSDSEFIAENSLYPLGRGAVFFTNSQNTYKAAPSILNHSGYYTASLHPNNKSFWNRDIMYKSLGYQRFYHSRDYVINDANSVNWGLKDKEFFKQSIQHLKGMPQPFYAKFITLTNHYPFTLGKEDQSIGDIGTGSKTLNRYIMSVRYADEALRQFITDLKASGLYDNSLIILYGDHYGISQNHRAAMKQFLGREITPYESTQLQRVPLFIRIPGKEGKIMDAIAGQIDIQPTLLHLLGIETNHNISFGNDLFSPNHDGRMVILRDSSFITDRYVFTKDICYDRRSGGVLKHDDCRLFEDKAKQELQYSDRIIYGDLLRFDQ
ncbi:LTA synthase family protein [Actinomycetes bacterium NPDC127524]